MASKKAQNIGWWITTVLVVLPNLGAALGYLSGSMDEVFLHLGYALYVPMLLAVWKLLGALALLNPKRDPWSERIREWAYAGFFFVFTGAAVSHIASGDGVGEVAPPLVLLGLLVGSYLLRLGRGSPQD